MVASDEQKSTFNGPLFSGNGFQNYTCFVIDKIYMIIALSEKGHYIVL